MRRTVAGCCQLVAAVWAFGAGAPVVTSIQQFWDLPAEQRAQELELELPCTVTYFDPDWQILFVQDDHGSGAYVPYGESRDAFEFGSAILVRGRLVPPNVDLKFDHATVTPRPGRPLVPVEATARVHEARHYDNRFVVLEGVVDQVRRSDERHLQLNLSVNGESVYVWVKMDPGTATPNYMDRRIRVTGVYNPKLAPDGTLMSLELMAASTAQITPLGSIADDPGFRLPVSPINTVPNHPARELVRVTGSVVARDPGHLLRIRDSGGQLDVMTGQMRPVAIGETVEAIGYPVTNGLEWRLENGTFREMERVPAPASGPDQPRVIGLAADVMNLSADEAAQGRPVHLTGVVTWSNAKAPFFFIHDSSGGVCVQRGTSTSMVRSPGRNVEVIGVTGVGAFAPDVVATSFERVSEAIVPKAAPVSLEHALTGAVEAQWVEMRGYLRHIEREGDWNLLEIATSTEAFTAVLPANEDATAMVGSVIRLHGACTAEADGRRKLTGIKLWVPGIAYLQVEEAAPTDPFALPARSLAALGQYETVQAFNRRVRVTGTVLRQLPGHSINLAEGGHSLLILTSGETPVQPGDQLEAVGFLGRQGGRITLSEVVYRVARHGPEPVAQELVPGDRVEAEFDGQLVRFRGTLLGAARVGRFTQFTIQSAHKIFEATVEPAPDDPAAPETGSRVVLTGVYSVGYDERSRPDSFALRLRTLADLQVIETPSWWTRTRLLAITGIIALGALWFLVWVRMLRRQVRRQTDQILRQVEREAGLQGELARAGKLESLGLLAGGIAHDFNNLLTVLIGNMSLLRLEGGLGPEAQRSLGQAEKAAARARDLTQQLLTFARGGAPLRSAVSLPEVVREVAEFAVRGSKVRCEFTVAPDLWPANVDRGQIGQVVQNIVINAQQAIPEGGVVEISLANRAVGAELAGVLAPGRYVLLEFIDHGPGIAAADLTRIFDPYFTTKKKGSGLGLATVHSIVKKHGGHVSATSDSGAGTRFHIWLPAAETPAPARVDSTPAVPLPPVAPVKSQRVLLLDDEEFIRDLAGSILRRYGYEPTAVADGTAAVAEYRSAREGGRPFALVILDLTIPGGMGGREAMEELLKLDPAVKAIVSSGYSNDLVLANYQAHGFRGIISKPYDVADFAQIVERVIRGDRA